MSHAGPSEVLDWLVVSRLHADALEVVRLAPSFEWGGSMNKTFNCRAILNVHAENARGDERMLIVGSKHQVKIFRWRRSR